MKKILILFLIGCLAAISFAEEEPDGCKQGILNSTMVSLSLPIKSDAVEAVIAPNDKEMLFKLRIWLRQLRPVYNEKGAIRYYDLDESIRGRDGRNGKLSIEKSKKIIKQWQQEQGVEFHDVYGTQELVKSEFWIYKIKETKWLKLDFLEGNELYNEWNLLSERSREEKENLKKLYKNAVVKYGLEGGLTTLDEALGWISYDKSKIVSLRKIGKKTYRIFGREYGNYGIYKLGLFCLDGNAEREFDVIKTGEGTSLFCKWSHTGNFVWIKFGGDLWVIFFDYRHK